MHPLIIKWRIHLAECVTGRTAYEFSKNRTLNLVLLATLCFLKPISNKTSRRQNESAFDPTLIFPLLDFFY